jgi:hypothetical protein
VERDDELSVGAIKRHFEPEDFPSKMILDVGTDGVIQFPQETFPDSPDRGSWSVIRYRGLDGRIFKYEEGFDAVGEKEIERMVFPQALSPPSTDRRFDSVDAKSDTAVGTWMCEKAVRLGPDLEVSSLILLMFQSKDPEDHYHHHRHQRHVQDYARRLQDYFNREPEMLNSIQENPLFIYVALYECFNSFRTILHQFERLYHDAVSSMSGDGRCCAKLDDIDRYSGSEPGKEYLRSLWAVLPAEQRTDQHVVLPPRCSNAQGGYQENQTAQPWG